MMLAIELWLYCIVYTISTVSLKIVQIEQIMFFKKFALQDNPYYQTVVMQDTVYTRYIKSNPFASTLTHCEYYVHVQENFEK